MTHAPFIQFFDSVDAPLHDLLGGKCASLVALTQAGMPVPPGFAITTAAYDAFIDAAGIRADIHQLLDGLDADDIAEVDRVSAQLRFEIESRPVPAELHALFVDAYHALQARFREPVPVAVRSSATAEDLPDASFAGQQDTYLWLTGIDDVAAHIHRCWASLYTSRAITYRLKNNIPNEGLSMAVAVQKMVNARAAGVAITMDPTTGDRSKIVIEAAYGLGELVVSGLVTPDNITVDKIMLMVVKRVLGDKHAELVPDPSTKALAELEVSAERRAQLSISETEITAIATIAKKAEKHFKCPQDIEWALDRDLPDGENLLLLQSRPETVFSSKAQTPVTPAGGFGIESITRSLMVQAGKA
ncbi:PEP/pyruvate-binding domain-containing protein [Cryobacterium psychrophilum]|uniref:Phosphoenolpyruvate synthase n=1 Tax=Cryobacterium psychrophilum TaxID=41988 RepID=A0A4Y8KN11_9MICO|nr:PEP/pyruvate-binding domain-containing protein [Cryobacterium psychrophilum]TDW31592.1 pyruvate,water dikinase [Cryobacterium psychrophilum]TFD75179.1 phosphoenolpyruvate synthase [Cryobacterium psychrophilum]